jgi:hypothetical protein
LLDKITFNPCFCCPANLPSNMLAVCQYPKYAVLYYMSIIWCDFPFLLKYWHYVDHSALIIYISSDSVSCKYRTWIAWNC